MMVRFNKDPNALRGTHHPGMSYCLVYNVSQFSVRSTGDVE